MAYIFGVLGIIGMISSLVLLITSPSRFKKQRDFLLSEIERFG